MQSSAIQVSVRATHGKGDASRLRKLGLVPAVVYGHRKETALLQVDAKALDKVLAMFGRGGLVDLDIRGSAAGSQHKTVLVKDVQHGILDRHIVHIDFQEVAMDEKAKVSIPIVVIGEDDRHKDAGTVQHFLREVHVSALPADIPVRASVDATGMGPGETVRVRDLHLGDRVQIETPLDEVVFTISHPHSADDDESEPNDQHPVQATSPAVVNEGE